MTKSKTTQGFTLIELSIVIIITGVALAGAIEAYKIYSEKQKIENTKSVLAHIDQNLKDFPNTIDPTTADPNTGLGGSLYERLPCPDIDADGREDCAMATVRGRRFDGDPNGPNVMIGNLPYTTLGLAMDYATDPYGNPIIYAVTQSAANAANYGTGIGAIQITDDGGNQSSTNQYVVVSTGRLGCGGDGADIENCDGDADFIAAFQTDIAGQYYDDRVLSHAQVPTLVNTDEPSGCEQYDTQVIVGDTCPDGWSPLDVEDEQLSDIAGGGGGAFLSGLQPVKAGVSSSTSPRFYNKDEKTGDYYFTRMETPETVGNSNSSSSVACQKENNNAAKTRCFNDKLSVPVASATTTSWLGMRKHNSGIQVSNYDYEELNNACPSGYKAYDFETGVADREDWESDARGNAHSASIEYINALCSR